MSLESASYVSQLVPSNPLITDPIAQFYAHVNLLKSVLQTQFPNLGAAAVSATAAQLNALATTLNTTTGAMSVPAPSPASGALGGSVVLDGASGSPNWTIQANGTTLTISQGSTVVWTLDTAGDVTATGAISGTSFKRGGYDLLPVGCILMWSGSVASIPGGWALCNGSGGTPNLTGNFVAHADGSFLVPGQTGGASAVTGTTSTAGSHSHGGATQAGGAVTPTASTDTQGAHSHGGFDGPLSLSVAQLPSHDHGLVAMGNIVSDTYPSSNVAKSNTGPGVGFSYNSGSSVGSGAAHQHSISSDGAHAHNVTVNPLPNHTHAISSDGSHNHTVTVATVPPFYALCYIMKVA